MRGDLVVGYAECDAAFVVVGGEEMKEGRVDGKQVGAVLAGVGEAAGRYLRELAAALEAGGDEWVVWGCRNLPVGLSGLVIGTE